MVWKGQWYSTVNGSQISKAENVLNTEVVEVSTDKDGVLASTLLLNDVRYNYGCLYNIGQSSIFLTLVFLNHMSQAGNAQSTTTCYHRVAIVLAGVAA